MKIVCGTGLTVRESEIIGLIAEGHTSKEIAEMLYVSPDTVATHRKNICRKLDAHSTAALVRFAVELKKYPH